MVIAAPVAAVAAQAVTAAAQPAVTSGPWAIFVAIGMMLIGPDHIGTLVALGSASHGMSAFKAGAAWGLGHTMAMLVVAPVFFAVLKASSSSAAIWEYYGDYCIGSSMLLCGLYFIVYESSYLQREADGSYKALACACHPKRSRKEMSLNLRAAYMSPHQNCTEPVMDEESAPLIGGSAATDSAQMGDHTWTEYFFGSRGVQGFILGVLQGVCCPMGLLGVQIIAQMGTNTGFCLWLVYILVFVVGSVVCSGLLTLGWGLFTALRCSKLITPQLLYRASCGFTAVLGVVWILANLTGMLNRLDYTQSLQPDMQMDDTAVGTLGPA